MDDAFKLEEHVIGVKRAGEQFDDQVNSSIDQTEAVGCSVEEYLPCEMC